MGKHLFFTLVVMCTLIHWFISSWSSARGNTAQVEMSKLVVTDEMCKLIHSCWAVGLRFPVLWLKSRLFLLCSASSPWRFHCSIWLSLLTAVATIWMFLSEELEMIRIMEITRWGTGAMRIERGNVLGRFPWLGGRGDGKAWCQLLLGGLHLFKFC